ncbi:MAG: leucyl aminopeptidase family protein [Planctomycetota bacterium]|jgi:leucyl aminopeptidase
MFASVSVGTKQLKSTLVVGITRTAGGNPSLPRGAKALDRDGSMARALRRSECTGKAGNIVEVHPDGAKPASRVIMLGFGESKKCEEPTIRTSLAALGRRLASVKETSATIDVLEALPKGVDGARVGQLIGECFGMLACDFTGYKGSGTNAEDTQKISLHAPAKAVRDGMARGLRLADAVNTSRLAAFTPPNIATPMWMAAQARKLARKHDTISVSVIKGAQLEKERLEGHLNVGKASENEACMIRIAYTPKRGRKSDKPIVMVGKTITYDTGGLSIKPTSNMKGMKGDKCGGCSVLGAMQAIADVIQPSRPVVGLLVAAENSISDEAYRPDDVLTFRNGVTVEVTNTDAEGRLVLADGLCWACEKENPACVIDMATLTGGVVVALGSTFAGLWCDDEKLRRKLEDSAGETDERLWRLPHHPEYHELMKSPIADVVNSSAERKAHGIQGAVFLSYFVEEDVPWAHIDIAGVTDATSDAGGCVKGTPTGYGVRLMASLVESY